MALHTVFATSRQEPELLRNVADFRGACLSALTSEELGQVLHEQLGYLIQFADREQTRFERVKSILMETFH